jgi:hypothetical protein
MIAQAVCPPLNDLHRLIDKIQGFPISNGQVIELAKKKRAPKEVVDFYQSINDSRIYDDKDDLIAVSEQIDLMRQEEADMPAEIERGPEEY